MWWYWVWFALHWLLKLGAEYCALQMRICRERRMKKLLAKKSKLKPKQQEELNRLLEEYNDKDVIILK